MSILGDILREMTDSWNEQSKRNVTVNVPTLDQPTRVGNYPPLSPEREAEWQKTAPRMSRAEAAAYAPADARAGPYGFISQAILSRPEEMPSHVARDVGFVNYLTEYKRIERESKMMRDMMRDRAVGGQLKRISDFRKMMDEDNAFRMMSQQGATASEAAQKYPRAREALADAIKAEPRTAEWFAGDGEQPAHWKTAGGTVVQPYGQRDSELTKYQNASLAQREAASVREAMMLMPEGADKENARRRLASLTAEYHRLTGTPTSEGLPAGDIATPQISGSRAERWGRSLRGLPSVATGLLRTPISGIPGIMGTAGPLKQPEPVAPVQAAQAVTEQVPEGVIVEDRKSGKRWLYPGNREDVPLDRFKIVE